MRARAILAALLLALLVRVDVSWTAPSRMVPGQLIVIASGAEQRASIQKVIDERYPGSPTGPTSVPMLHVHVPPGSEGRAMRELRALEGVVAVEPAHWVHTLGVPNDPLYRDYQWDLRRLEMEAVWEITTGDPSVIVAVLDTGVDASHVDLAGNTMAGFDVLNDDPDASDDGIHGTHVAGVIGAVGNNGIGVAGMAWRTRIFPVKVLDSQGLGPDVVVAKGIIYAVEQGARIINVSSGTPYPSVALREAVEFADRRGALIVAAAGNSGDKGNEVVYPAAYPQVIAVGALDERDQTPPFSQRHAYVTVAAPGVNIASTVWPAGANGSLYGSGTGTSAAAPHVSALAALLWGVEPKLSKNDIRRLITENADDLGQPGRDDASGAGRINPVRTINALLAGARRGPAEPLPVAIAPVSPPTAPLLPVAPPSVSGPAMPPAYRWFFADGRTTDGFETRLVLFNPSGASVAGQLHLVNPAGTAMSSPVRLGPGARQTVSLNDLLPNAEFAIRLDTDATIYVERTMTFGHDLSTLAGLRGPSVSWFLADGRVDDEHSTTIYVANAESRETRVTVSLFGEAGPLGELQRTIVANGRIAIDPSEVPAIEAFSAIIQADGQIVVERKLLADDGNAGDTSTGSKAPSKVWYFTDGDGRPDFDTRLTIFNPNPEATQVKLQTIRSDGPGPNTSITVGPLSRVTVPLSELAGPIRFGLRLDSELPIAAERTSFVQGGISMSSGVNQPGTEWYLAEGETSPTVVQSITILNPNTEEVGVEVTFYPEDGGAVRVHRLRLRPMSRASIDVNRLFPTSRMAAKISADKAITVERTQYSQDLRGSASAAAVAQ